MKATITLTLLFLGVASCLMILNQKTAAPLSIEEAQSQAKKDPATAKAVELSKLQRIDKAYELEFEKTVSPEGIVPRHKLPTAYRALKQRQEVARNNNRNSTLWEERGPSNVGGRTRALMFDLSSAPDYNRVFVGGVGGGIWVTDNFNDAAPTWTPVNDFLQNIAITFLAQDPTNHNLIYAGTGEGWRNADRITGVGIYRSSDGGNTFELMPGTTGFSTTQKLIFTPNGDLYAATEDGVQRNLSGTSTWEKVLGIDGISTDVPNHEFVADLELASDGTLWAGFGRIFLDGFLFKSSTGDAGSWTNAYPGLAAQRVEIACAPSDPNVVYVLCEDQPGGPTGVDPLDPAGTNASFFYRTTDGGALGAASFTRLPAPRFCDQAQQNNFTRNQAWYDLISIVDPSDPMVYYVGGVDCMRSTDGGASFVQISSWTGGNLCPTLGQDQFVHADHHAMVFVPGTDNQLLHGSDGGLAFTTDSKELLPIWVSKNTGYNVTQYYACAIADVIGTTDILAGAQDNGTQRYTQEGYASTVTVTGGDGAFCHIDQDEPNIQMSSFVFNSYWITNNSWGSNTRITPASSAGRFINPTDYDDENNTLYCAAAANQYIRIDAVGTSNSSSTVTAGFEDGTISAIRMSPNTPHRFFAATDDGSANGRNDKLFRVDNADGGSPTVVRLDPNEQLPSGSGAYINCVQVQDGDDDHLLVVLSNFGQDNVWESQDGGMSWTRLDGDLPDMPVRWIVFNPTDDMAQSAIIATEVGVWTTDMFDGDNTHWEPTGMESNFPNVRTDMIQFRKVDNFMVAATHGRGLYSTASYTGGGGGNPTLTFGQASLQIREGANTQADDCNRDFSTVEVNVSIIAGVGAQAVTYEVDPSSTAKLGNDYDFVNSSNQLNFAGGIGIETLTIPIKVYDDGTLDDNTETLVLSLNIPSGVDEGRFSTFSLNILDNDVPPSLSEQTTVSILDEDFTGEDFDNSDTWEVNEINTTGPNFWAVGTSTTIGTPTAAVITLNAAAPIDQYGTDNADDNSNDVILQTKNMIDGRGLKDINLSFEWGAGGESDATNPTEPAAFDYGELVYSLDGTNYLGIGELFIGTGLGAAAPAMGTFDEALTILEGQQFKIGFRWRNDQLVSGTASFAIDDVLLTATPNRIESELNAMVSHFVGADDQVYFYSENDGEIITQISAASSDLGCTMTSISQTGANTNTNNIEDGQRTDKVVQVENPAMGNYTITLYYTNAELANLGDPTMLRIGKATGDLANPTTVEIDGNTIASPIMDVADGTTIIGYQYSSSRFSSFSSFFLTNASATPLATELLSVKADLIQANTANITWQTATERDNKGFEVERSFDLRTFETLGFVASQGDATSVQFYAFQDKNLKSGQVYYRIKAIDNSGAFTYSNVVSVTVKGEAEQLLSLAPNPFQDYFNLVLSEAVAEDAQIELLDLNGRVLRVLAHRVGTLRSFSFEVGDLNLSAGVYFVRLRSADSREVMKVVKR